MVSIRHLASDWRTYLTAGVVLAAILALLALYGPAGEVCAKNEYTGVKECTPHNIVYVALWVTNRTLNDLSGVLTALATIVIAIFTITLWRVGKDQHDRLRETISHAKESSERQLRAYVCLKVGTIHRLGVGQTPRAAIVLENNGQTPAYALCGRCRMRLHRGPDEPVFPPPDFSDARAIAVGPGGVHEFNMRLSDALTAQDWLDLQEGSAQIWVEGHARYVDAFGHDRRTSFRLVTRPDLLDTGKLMPGRTGNEAT